MNITHAVDPTLGDKDAVTYFEWFYSTRYSGLSKPRNNLKYFHLDLCANTITEMDDYICKSK